jgi:methylmalonyl-CoA/ethylmalonyl-CoA epimerase
MLILTQQGGADMAFKGVHHVVVRVKDLEAAIEGYRQVLDMEPERKHSDALKADQAFYYFDNGTFLELISPTDPSSPVAGPLDKRGEGIHTVAFAVDSVKDTVSELDERGVRTVGGAFVHPAATNGVLLQLSQ